MAGGGDEGEESGSQPPQAGFDGPMKMITDIWGKSIIELHLEIDWKEGEQVKSYTLMTHYIASDATKQIQGMIGGLMGSAGAGGASSGDSQSGGSSGGAKP